jgi:D-3-phosphoglycerate dehydrogenase / 2-oxoglutarate reductase
MGGKVIFIDTVHPVLQERLERAGFSCIDASKLDYQACAEIASDAVGIVIRSRFRMDENFLKDATKLEFIARSGAGMENIDVAYCENRGIELFNAPEGNRNAVAEHALGMLLNLFRNIKKGDSEVRTGVWDREGNRGIELDGKTVGIIGFGNNGSAFAKKLSGFDVQVLAYDKYKTVPSLGQVEAANMERIFNEADIISFHVPQTEETLFWGNTKFFERLKKPIYLLNMSRGKIVKTQDLLDAIDQGKVLGACLDVLEFESTSFSEIDKNETLIRLLNHPKVLLTPHIAGWTHESYFLLSDVLADKILTR